ncbi:MAG: hypothetical protein KDK78_01425 [Chlamydiia bacterium]|nr:hypothetical protein [Chlamydiia bacterium]
MFRPQLLTSLAVLALLTTLLIWEGVEVSESDRIFYQALLASSSPSRESTPSVYVQTRKGNQKEAWFGSGADRLHLQLSCEDAALEFFHSETQSSLVEKMYDIDCWMQEALYYTFEDGTELRRHKDGGLCVESESGHCSVTHLEEEAVARLRPLQRVRHMQAAQADYLYQDRLIIAEQVRLARCIAPGHELSSTLEQLDPLMTGTADNIEIHFESQPPVMRAHQFRAEFKSKQGLL